MIDPGNDGANALDSTAQFLNYAEAQFEQLQKHRTDPKFVDNVVTSLAREAKSLGDKSPVVQELVASVKQNVSADALAATALTGIVIATGVVIGPELLALFGSEAAIAPIVTESVAALGGADIAVGGMTPIFTEIAGSSVAADLAVIATEQGTQKSLTRWLTSQAEREVKQQIESKLESQFKRDAKRAQHWSDITRNPPQGVMLKPVLGHFDNNGTRRRSNRQDLFIYLSGELNKRRTGSVYHTYGGILP